MIKFEHTLFALPFAFLGAILAANGLPTWWQILWITVAMFGARSAAMTFNRIVDRDIDAKNPRTAEPRATERQTLGRFCLGISICFDRRFPARVVLAQLANFRPVAGRSDLCSRLFVCQTLYGVCHILSLAWPWRSRRPPLGSLFAARSMTKSRSCFRYWC